MVRVGMLKQLRYPSSGSEYTKKKNCLEKRQRFSGVYWCDYSDLPCMELLDDELGYYMDCMAGCWCFVCSIAWCGENGVKEWQ